MKIRVRIEDIEIEVDRPRFREAEYLNQDTGIMNDVVIPQIEEMTNKVKELYKLKNG